MNSPSPDYPHPSSAAATATMKANRRVDTGPEQAVRSILHRRGYRFRKDHPVVVPGRLRVRPDIVFPRERLAVFIDGCFWHACPEHRAKRPVANAAYWHAKFERNVARDRKVERELRAAGWRVVRIWEHVPPDQAAEQVASEATRLRSKLGWA